MQATRTWLEMTSPADLRPVAPPRPALRVDRIDGCPPALYRELYAEVGRRWRWIDRAGWSDEDIARHLGRPDITLWVASAGGARAGYFELQRHADGSVEIAYFGLLPAYIGLGLGGWLLSEAVRCAWALGAHRVWLHTCTLDHPAALPNYLARGFRPYRAETFDVGDEPAHLGEPAVAPPPDR